MLTYAKIQSFLIDMSYKYISAMVSDDLSTVDINMFKSRCSNLIDSSGSDKTRNFIKTKNFVSKMIQSLSYTRKDYSSFNLSSSERNKLKYACILFNFYEELFYKIFVEES